MLQLMAQIRDFAENPPDGALIQMAEEAAQFYEQELEEVRAQIRELRQRS
jgi:hypothetical protein